MNIKFLILVAVGAMVSAATYYGLNIYAPYHKEEIKVATGITVDEVFSGGLQAAPADSETVAEPVSMEPEPEAPAASSDEMSAEPASEDATVASGAADEPVEALQSEPALEESEAVSIAPPEPAVEEPAQQEPAPAPKVASKPAPPKKTAATAEPAAVWWGKEDPNKLSLLIATSASDKKAIVLMFNGAFNTADTADRNISILNSKGSRMDGKWLISAKNKRLLFFPVSSAGNYTVIIKPGVQDRDGRTVTREMRGPVVVK